MQAPDLLTADEVAELLRMGRRTVAEKLSKRPGFPRPFRPGKAFLWDRGEVLDWLERTRQSSSRRTRSSTAGA